MKVARYAPGATRALEDHMIKTLGIDKIKKKPSLPPVVCNEKHNPDRVVGRDEFFASIVDLCPASTAQIIKASGLHQSTVSKHINALRSAGRLVRINPGRLPAVYRANPSLVKK